MQVLVVNNGPQQFGVVDKIGSLLKRRAKRSVHLPVLMVLVDFSPSICGGKLLVGSHAGHETLFAQTSNGLLSADCQAKRKFNWLAWSNGRVLTMLLLLLLCRSGLDNALSNTLLNFGSGSRVLGVVLLDVLRGTFNWLSHYRPACWSVCARAAICGVP